MTPVIKSHVWSSSDQVTCVVNPNDTSDQVTCVVKSHVWSTLGQSLGQTPPKP
jgi:hypothetical protein